MRKLPADLIPALLAAAYHKLSESVCDQSSEIGDDDIAIADSAGARRAGRHEDGATAMFIQDCGKACEPATPLIRVSGGRCHHHSVRSVATPSICECQRARDGIVASRSLERTETSLLCPPEATHLAEL